VGRPGSLTRTRALVDNARKKTSVWRITYIINVKLLDTVNFYKYQSGKPYDATSEHLDLASVEIKVPFKSTWHVIIEHSYYDGPIRANVSVV
jgi:hypothetical protein